jgi:basic membrane protein A
MVKHVEVAVFNTVQETQAGRFPGGIQVFGLAEDGVGWVYDDRNKALIPDAVKARVDSLRDEIVAGRITAPSQ